MIVYSALAYGVPLYPSVILIAVLVLLSGVKCMLCRRVRRA